MTAPSPAGLSPLLDQLDVRVSPDRKLVALRASDTEPRWRVSNGGHYRDRDVHGWPSLTAAIRAMAELADEMDAETTSAMARADQMERTEENVRHHAAERRHARVAAHAAASIRSALAAALTPGADTAGAAA